MSSTTSQSRMQWWLDARLGMFIHWRPVCQIGRSESALYREHLTPSEYRKLADTFAPRRYDPDAWMRIAREAGLRYAVLTAKQHDGFLMWASDSKPYNAGQTGLRRDYVREYLEACRRANIKAGLYFSLPDWSEPAYFDGPKRDPTAFNAFIERVHAQVRELCSNYGRIDIMWFDGGWPYPQEQWRARQLLRMIRRLQPDCLINDRFAMLPGDFATPEQKIPEQQFKPSRPWETCLTTTETHWGYHRGARWKTDADIIRDVSRVVDVGGNLLLNVGPKPDGSFAVQFVRLAKKLGRWLESNGEAVYGTTETICDTRSFGGMSIKGNRVFLHVLDWLGPELLLAGLKSRVVRARLLATNTPLTFRQDATHLWVTGLPRRAPDPRVTVIELTTDGPPQSHIWARQRIWTGAFEPGSERALRVTRRLGPWGRT